MLAIILLIVGLIVGGAGGYFGAQFLVFGPERSRQQTQVSELQTQVATLQQQVATLQAGSGNSGTATGSTGTGTGTAPSGANNITPDPQTASWQTYTDAERHISFKYPAGYEVRSFQNSGDLAQQTKDANVFLVTGIFKVGESTPAGALYFHKTGSEAQSHDGLVSNSWVATLPTLVLQKSAGAGLVNDVSEQTVTLNGTQVTKMSAQAGSKTTPDPSGITYFGYLFENQFSQTIDASYCSSDQTTERNQVACLWLTTITVLR